MARRSRSITDAELQVLEALWACPDQTTREIARTVYHRERSSDAATVLKLLERLEAKGLVTRSREAGLNRFTALKDRESLVGRELRAMALKLCGGSMTPLLTHLVEGDSLTDEERRALRALLDRKGPREQRPRRRGGQDR